ncbi:MAG: GAF domain-containing protein, partial [Anaerolineae bacterium]
MAGLHVTSTMELEPILEAILTSALHLAGGTNARIFLYDGRRLALGAAAGPEELRPEPDAEPRPPSTTYSVARTGERVVIPDVRSHPLVEDGEWDERHAAAVGLPLKVGDQVEGVMTIAFDGTHEFGEDELSVLELLGDQAAIAIENARLYRDAQRHVEELTALHNIDVAITSTLSFEEVLERIHQQISKVMDIGTFYIGLYHKSRNELSLPLVVDQGIRADPSTLDLRDGGGLAGWVVRNTEPV